MFYQRSADAIHSEVEGEIVALHVEQGQCFGMNDVASAVWRLLDTPRDIQELCDELTVTYDVDRAECEADLRPLLATLLEDGLIRVVHTR